MRADRDGLPLRVYARVLLFAAVCVAALYWFTATFNHPLERP